ncbi:protein of unknown function [Paraburkholderia kururiensis]|jgi:hypothetical protein
MDRKSDRRPGALPENSINAVRFFPTRGLEGNARKGLGSQAKIKQMQKAFLAEFALEFRRAAHEL